MRTYSLCEQPKSKINEARRGTKIVSIRAAACSSGLCPRVVGRAALCVLQEQINQACLSNDKSKLLAKVKRVNEDSGHSASFAFSSLWHPTRQWRLAWPEGSMKVTYK